ncbi:hypothetical protein ACJX0J_032670 [Zea mays]
MDMQLDMAASLFCVSLFTEMIGAQPDHVTFLQINHGGLIDKGLCFYDSIRSGKLDDAWSFIANLQEIGNPKMQDGVGIHFHICGHNLTNLLTAWGHMVHIFMIYQTFIKGN